MHVDVRSLRTMELIPAISQDLQAPTHLDEWCSLLDRAAMGEPVRAMCAEPIRHFKSQTTMHGVIRILLQDPTTPIIHLSHSYERAQVIGKRIRQLAEACDKSFGTNIGPERGQSTIADWRNSSGGGVVVMSAEQSKLGYDCGCLIADDPLDERGALDPIVREAVDSTLTFYTARCMRRGKPGPVLLVMSRWHADDPMGRRLARTARQWHYISHRAIDTYCCNCGSVLRTISPVCPECQSSDLEERAFAPAVWPLAELKAMRAELAEKDPTERIWWAQLQNDPHPEGSDLFGDPTFYTKLPDWHYRRAFGVDMAYTTTATSDWFARTAGRIYGTRMHLIDVTRHRLDAHMIQSTLARDMETFGRAPFHSYMSGPEVGLARLLNERGVPIARMNARYNKLVRAQRTMARWNRGDILVPESAPWLKGFLHRVSYFRGREGDTDDDEIDALVSMCDGAMGGAVAGGGGPKTLGKAYGGLTG